MRAQRARKRESEMLRIADQLAAARLEFLGKLQPASEPQSTTKHEYTAEELAREMGMPLEWCEERLRLRDDPGRAFTADGVDLTPKPATTGRRVFPTEAEWLQQTRGHDMAFDFSDRTASHG